MASGPLLQLALTDDAFVQLKTNHAFLTRKYGVNFEPLVEKGFQYGHKKIRVGYVSSDLHDHAVAFLTAPLFECFNPEKFEVFAFSWSTEDHSAIRQRIQKSVTRYIAIGHLDDYQAAQLIAEMEVDILVDLHGLTSGARPEIFSYRPAPFTINYLGLPATTGHPQIDYILADEFLMPPEYAPFYSEKPLYLPSVFQMSDDQRKAAKVPSKAEKGLPEDTLIFCCFNNNYKFTAEMFGVWMNILKRVPNSVLWLLADNESAKQNMLDFARCQNIEISRLIFAERVLPADYLAQFCLADLYLDAFPFNGGTTANDVLFMDLPLVTYSGVAFASRMAGALLHALGLDECIAESFEDYENKVVSLALDKVALKKLRAKLINAKADTQIFNSAFLVSQVEKVYENLLAKS